MIGESGQDLAHEMLQKAQTALWLEDQAVRQGSSDYRQLLYAAVCGIISVADSLRVITEWAAPDDEEVSS